MSSSVTAAAVTVQGMHPYLATSFSFRNPLQL